MASSESRLQGTIVEYLGRLRAGLDALSVPAIEDLVRRLHLAYREGRRVFVIGNGGSASTASHMACDLAKNIFGPDPAASSGRFRVISLTDNVATITALGNDLGYDRIFTEQLRQLAEPGDTLIIISGSGNSPNVVHAAMFARGAGLETIGILGFGGGKLKDLVDLTFIVPSDEYGPVEDIHLVLNHIVTTCLKEMVSA